MNEVTSEMGMVRAMMTVERQLPRKMSTTSTTKSRA